MRVARIATIPNPKECLVEAISENANNVMCYVCVNSVSVSAASLLKTEEPLQREK